MWSSYYSQQQWETFLWDWYSVHVDKHPTNGGYKLVLMGQLLPSDCLWSMEASAFQSCEVLPTVEIQSELQTFD